MNGRVRLPCVPTMQLHVVAFQPQPYLQRTGSSLLLSWATHGYFLAQQLGKYHSISLMSNRAVAVGTYRRKELLLTLSTRTLGTCSFLPSYLLLRGGFAVETGISTLQITCDAESLVRKRALCGEWQHSTV